jgi:putative ABC transport system permease protein
MDRWNADIRARLAAARLNPAREAEIAQELAQHLDDRYAELRRDGIAPDDARAQALDELKDHARMREQLAAVERRESTVPPAGAPPRDRLLAGLWQDVRFALRALRLNPGFAALALTTLALGIAATTVIYAVVDTVLLRPLPYRDADRLVHIWETSGGDVARRSAASYANFVDWRTESRTIDAMAVVTNVRFTLIEGEPEEVDATGVTQDFLRLNGLAPLHGRDFVEADYQPGATPAAILSHGAWLRRFGGAQDVIGRRLQTTGASLEIVGVLPDVGIYWGGNDLLVPFTPPAVMAAGRHIRAYSVFGRLRPGVTVAEAQAEMDTIAARLTAAHPDTNAGAGVWLQPVRDFQVGSLRQPLYMFLGAVFCVLLIACVNVAGLQVARGAGRGQEIAVRIALGASRGRIVRQLLTESVVLAAAGGALGVLLAWWLFAAIVPLLPVFLPGDVAAIDTRVIAIVLAASALTGVLFGALPAFGTAGAGAAEGLKVSGRTTSGWGRKVGAGLVLVEIALALVLLTGAGLMVRTLASLYAIDPGFEPRSAVAWRVQPVLTGDRESQAIRRDVFYRSLLDAVRGVPGVRSAALVDTPPFRGTTVNVGATPEGAESPVSIVSHNITPGYFETMGIPILEGRDLTDADAAGVPTVAIVSAAAAARLWPGRSAIGAGLRIRGAGFPDGPLEVIGVAGNVRHRSLDSDLLTEVYLPTAQGSGSNLIVVARGHDVGGLVAALPTLVPRLPERAIAGPPQTFDELIAATTLQRRNRATLFGVLAGLGLLLAIVGIVGVTAHAVAQRTREIGIRMALGAQQGSVLRTIMGGLAVPLVAGITLGLLGAWAASRTVESFLFGVERTDPIAFAAAPLLLAAAAIVACYVPARRALRVDPVVALRAE